MDVPRAVPRAAGPGWQEGLGTPAAAGPRRQICGPGGWREILHYDNKSLH